jgi:hypothetical protein
MRVTRLLDGCKVAGYDCNPDFRPGVHLGSPLLANAAYVYSVSPVDIHVLVLVVLIVDRHEGSVRGCLGVRQIPSIERLTKQTV